MQINFPNKESELRMGSIYIIVEGRQTNTVDRMELEISDNVVISVKGRKIVLLAARQPKEKENA